MKTMSGVRRLSLRLLGIIVVLTLPTLVESGSDSDPEVKVAYTTADRYNYLGWVDLTGKECIGLSVPFKINDEGVQVPLRYYNAMDCEAHCHQDAHCEAWQFINYTKFFTSPSGEYLNMGTCVTGTPFPGDSCGHRPFWPPRGAEHVMDEYEWYRSGKLDKYKPSPEVQRLINFYPGWRAAYGNTAGYFNNQVVGARVRFFNYEYGGKSWHQRTFMQSHLGTIFGIQRKDSSTVNTGGVDSSSANETVDSAMRSFTLTETIYDPGKIVRSIAEDESRQFHETRLKYRIGYHSDNATLEFCSRKAALAEWPVDDDMKKTKLDEHDQYSILKLRSAIPEHLRTGRYINFGSGDCKRDDPMNPLYNHELDEEDSKKAANPPWHGVAFDYDPNGVFQVDIEKAVANVGKRAFNSRNVTLSDKNFSRCAAFTDTRFIFGRKVTPGNMVPWLKEATSVTFETEKGWKDRKETKNQDWLTDNVPIELVILDIDSWEGDVLEQLVSTNKTVLVYMIEIATHFPPPIRYQQTYKRTKANWEAVEEVATVTSENVTETDMTMPPLLQTSPIPLTVAEKRKIRTQKRDPFYRSKSRPIERNAYYNNLAGSSFSSVLDILKETHDFLFFPEPGDALFVHKSISRPYLQPHFRIKLPVDEFLCFAGSVLWFQYPFSIIKEWAVHANLYNVISNVTTLVKDRTKDKSGIDTLTSDIRGWEIGIGEKNG